MTLHFSIIHKVYNRSLRPPLRPVSCGLFYELISSQALSDTLLTQPTIIPLMVGVDEHLPPRRTRWRVGLGRGPAYYFFIIVSFFVGSLLSDQPSAPSPLVCAVDAARPHPGKQ